MNKKQYTDFIQETEKVLKDLGAVHIITYLDYHSTWILGTKTNGSMLNLEKYENTGKVFSIFGRFIAKPKGEMNSKCNLHVLIDKVRIEDVKNYLQSIINT